MIASFKTSDFAANLKAALRAACVYEARSFLSCIRIELSGGVARFVATNGHWLWVNETSFREVVGVDEKGTQLLGQSEAVVHVPLAAAKEIFRALEKSKKAADWSVELDTAGTVSQLGKVVPFTPAEDKFPPYREIVPASVGGKRIVCSFDAALMVDVLAAFAAVGSNASDAAPVSLHTKEDSREGCPEPILITSALAPAALAMVMPFRASRVGGGLELLAKYRAPAGKGRAA